MASLARREMLREGKRCNGALRKICGAVAWRVEVAWIPAHGVPPRNFSSPCSRRVALDATTPAYPVVAASYTTVHSICAFTSMSHPMDRYPPPPGRVDVALDFLAASNFPIVPSPILEASKIASERFTAPPLLCHGKVAVRRLSTSTRT